MAHTPDISDLTAEWDVPRVATGVTDAAATIALGGDPTWVTPVASITKPIVAYGVLVAVEEGTVDLDEPAGGLEGSTVRHLLAHASGLPFSGDGPVARVGSRRVYSNTGFERLGDHLETRAGMPWRDYVAEAVLMPLEMTSTGFRGGAGDGAVTCVADLLAFGRELLSPTLLAPSTMEMATTPVFPELRGTVPGVGSFDPCPWGLGFEIRGDKQPHWTGPTNSPRTFGHFGGAGTLLWIDPDAGLACVALTDRGFDSWALDVWPPFSDAVRARFAVT